MLTCFNNYIEIVLEAPPNRYIPVISGQEECRLKTSDRCKSNSSSNSLL